MSPLLRVTSTPVTRRSMTEARMGARKLAGSAPLFALAVALLAVSGWHPAAADESVPSAAPQPPSATAPAPAPSQNASVKADSVLQAAEPRDTVSKPQDAGTPASKDTPPAERVENASTAPGEKPAETAVTTPGLAKQTESPKGAPAGAALPRSESP